MMGRASKVNSQKGAALAVSLIMLTVLTILTLSTMNATLLDEKMAGNMKDLNLAFQSAETALMEGEDYVSQSNYIDADTTSGVYDASKSATEFWKTVNWSDANSVRGYSASLIGVGAAPKYIIEKLPESVSDTSSQVLGFGQLQTNEYYRVTAKGTGATNTANVFVQSVFKK